MRHRGRKGFGHLYRRGRVWWIKWSDANGRRRCRTSGSTDRAVAGAMLREQVAHRDRGMPVLPDPRKVSVDALLEGLLAEYRTNGRRSLDRVTLSRTHLLRYFGGRSAAGVTGDDTRFAWTFSRWGLVVDAGGAYLLPRLVGLPRAKAMVLLGEGVKGAEAVDMGLAYKCVAFDDLRSEGEALAGKLAAGPTRSLGLSKQLLNRTFETYLAASLELEGQFQSLATTSSDLAEGMAAFREKRDPRFTGR